MSDVIRAGMSAERQYRPVAIHSDATGMARLASDLAGQQPSGASRLGAQAFLFLFDKPPDPGAMRTSLLTAGPSSVHFAMWLHHGRIIPALRTASTDSTLPGHRPSLRVRKPCQRMRMHSPIALDLKYHPEGTLCPMPTARQSAQGGASGLARTKPPGLRIPEVLVVG